MAAFDALKALENLPTAALVADAAQRIQYANRAVKRLLGWNPAELIGSTLSALIPPPHETMEFDRPMIVRAAKADGSTREVELVLSGDEDGTIIATLRNPRITPESQDSLRKLRSILETISVGVLLAEGPEGKLTVVNPAADLMAGEPVRADSYAEFVSKFPLTRLDGRLIDLEDRPLARTMEDGAPVHETLKYVRKDGQELILEVTTAPFRGPRGGAVTTFLDVTKRYQLETDLAQSAAQLRTLLDHLPVGVAYFDKMAVCRAGNAPARRYLNRTRREIIGAPADELFSQESALRHAIHRCVAEQVPYEEQRVAWPDATRTGSIRYLDWHLVPLGSEPGKPRGALALITDVTERTFIEAEKQRALEAIEGASRRKTQFLSAVSHDLRTPINALSLQAELLSRIVEMRHEKDEDLNLLAGDIQVAAANLIELINDLLDLTRFDSGAIEHRPSDFELDEWLSTVLAPLELGARTRGLEFSWSTDRSGRIIHADRVKLGRVLTNLVGNAVKFTESGSVTIRAGADKQGRFFISVHDTGLGIPANQLDRIFDEFAQLRNPERDRNKGTGLGLAICRRLVEAVGGELLVKSEPGKGSTFTAIYPADHLRVGPSGPGSDHYVVFPPGRDSGESSSESILLVEGDERIRTTLKRLLEHEGYVVRTARNGDEALAEVRMAIPALVLLDLTMSGMDGRKFLRRLRAEPDTEGMKIVVLSGEVMDAQTGEIQAVEADGLLAKPVDLAALRELLSVILPASEEAS